MASRILINKNKLRQGSRLFFFLLLAVACINGCKGSGNQESNEIKIGAIASLTGAAGEQGKNWVDGATVAVNEANSLTNNNTADKNSQHVSLVVEDDQTQPAKVIAGFTKLATIDKVSGIVGGTWDFLGEAAYPLAKRYKIPFITPTNPVEVISSDAVQSGYVFSNAMSLQSMSETLTAFLTRAPVAASVKSVAIVFPDLPFGTQQAKMVKDILSAQGIALSFEYAFPPASLMSDTVKLAAQKIEEKKPDLTYMVIDYNGLDLFTKECKQLRIRPAIMTTQHLDQAFEFSKDPERYQRIFALYPESTNSNFRSAFFDTFKHSPHVFAEEGYNAVKLLIAVAKNKETLPKDTTVVGQSKAVVMTTDNGVFERYVF